MNQEEPVLEPERPIIDPHLHHWHILPTEGPAPEPQRFLFDEAMTTIDASGHDVTHSVFVECHAMHRAEGPEELRPLGETEFANGVAAMGASGLYGSRRLAHRIVGTVDMQRGAAVRDVLERHVAIAGERFRGIRMNTVWTPTGLFGFPCDPAAEGMLARPAFRDAAAVLADMDLSLDVWCVHTQLGEVAALADTVPGLTIVLDHLGTPECLGDWTDCPADAFAQWCTAIEDLAQRPNVVIKVGGMGMDLTIPPPAETGTATSEELAQAWRPRVETAIATFGPARAMFESNFPPDRAAGSYRATWNAFKRLAAGYGGGEKDLLFRGTAARVYRIEL